MSKNPRAVDGLETNEVNDGLIVYDDNHDCVHYLNATAAAVFTLCNGSRDRQGIADGISIVFGRDAVSPTEIEGLIVELQSLGLLR